MDGSQKITVLVVDDDPSMGAFLKDLLLENGFVPIILQGGDELAKIGQDRHIDIALVDLRLKEEDGLTLAQTLQQTRGIPIIILTAVLDEVEKIIGLELAADDYVMKPFNPRELIARIRAVLRRTYGYRFRDFRNSPALAGNSHRFGGHLINFDQRMLVDGTGGEVSLTNAEFRLLEFLVKNPNTVFNRQELLDHLGADISRYMDRSIDVLILRLRRKIEKTPSRPVFLQTRRGKGYVFVLEQGARQ
jgi:DNA-binding response OmpR family regulator